MITTLLATFIDLFTLVFNFLLLSRVILSWFLPADANLFTRTIYELTEPVLSPVRRLLPRSSVLDLAPLVTFLLLQLIQYGAHQLLLHFAS